MIPGPFRNLALIGFMGAGKTTAAAALADELGWEAADADAAIEQAAGKPIASIFADDGEARFRELEERVVGDLLQRIDTVVALGGGAVTSPVTREQLRDGSFTVLLDVSPQTAWRRVEAEAGERPLAVDPARFSDLYRERAPVYHETADALVDADEQIGTSSGSVPTSSSASTSASAVSWYTGARSR